MSRTIEYRKKQIIITEDGESFTMAEETIKAIISVLPEDFLRDIVETINGGLEDKDMSKLNEKEFEFIKDRIISIYEKMRNG